ncbi:MAG: hypothetical protein DME59_01310 [Verrucomicrobia bacterium]|nr:MAG: hypothetical protein DME59_01310 [Verrucomicrobiota bacterium]PYL70458.1 MAG: hypothetical protein DMF26_21945 [Verrucomicrobiota bacterium]
MRARLLLLSVFILGSLVTSGEELSENFLAAAKIASGFSSAINAVPMNPKKSLNIPIETFVFIGIFA